MNNVTSLPMCILEEIAFEGLEGITIEGLWKRISIRIKFPLPLNDQIKRSIWTFVQNAKCLQFYVLQTEREPLKLFDRVDAVDPFFGASEPESCPYNFFKYYPISDQNIRGSCQDFDTRQELEKAIIKENAVEDIEESYGRRLVIVASQSLRSSLLIPPTVSKEIDLNITGYCILERLGRSRYNGELAYGKFSLADIGGDPVAFHNQKKKLQRNKLVECQSFSQNIDGTNTVGQLVHLPRFFAKFKPRHMIVMEKIISILKTKPNYMAEYQDVKGHFEENLQTFLSRLFKAPLFHKFVLTDTKVPYRAIFPNATEREWKLPKKDSERTLNVLQLRDPNTEPAQFWDKCEGWANEQSDDEEDIGFLDESHETQDLPLMNQVYNYIKSTKEVGVSEPEVCSYFGQSKLNGRALVRNLMKEKKIAFYTTNHKRQNVRKYILPEFSKNQEDTTSEDTSNAVQVMNDVPTNGCVEEVVDLPVIEMSEADVKMEFMDSVCEDSTVTVFEIYEETEEANLDDHFKTDRDVLKEKIDGDIIVTITEINETDHIMPKRLKPLRDGHFTNKTKERLQFMQQEVQSKILFDDPSKLHNSLKQEEQSRGLTDTMCRKTFFRFLTYLCKNEKLRLWRIEFQYKSKHRALLYISNRSVDSSFSLMQSCIEQAKSKFQLNIYEEECRKEGRKIKASAVEPTNIKAEQGKRLNSATNQSFNYGTTPKFIRLRTLHEFMFYLAREHDTTELANQDEVVAQWTEAMPLAFDDLEKMPTIWKSEIEWKTFVPPLIKHNGFSKGWCLLSDCIFRMPLSIFVKVVNIAYEIKGLDEFISHPIKKHFLVKDIPLQLQKMLFARRKYITSLHDLIRRLICMGLVQAGPHRSMKDQAFYYLNSYATLLNTTSSMPSTYYTSEQDYPEHLYRFDGLENVTTYWDDMHRICMGTKLRKRPTSADQTPADKVLPVKFNEYVKSIQPRQAVERDIGKLPGDRRGAAGLDSYFFAHLERNWAFNPMKFKMAPPVKRSSDGLPMRYNRLVRMTRDVNLKKHESRITPVPLHKLKSAAIRRRAPIVRKKTMILKKKRIRNKYDDIDRMALQHMNKLRVDWNSKEDNFLLLCKVAQMYLNPNNRLVIPGHIIRDLIHWHCKSLNKTTYACRRRISYITRKLPNSDQINNSILMCLNEIKGNKSIQKGFGDNFIRNLKKVYRDENEFDKAIQIHFINLVHTLSYQYPNLTNSFESNTLILPRTLEEFNARFHERNDAVSDGHAIRNDLKNIDEVRIAMIITLIHSTMCCSYDKTSWSIQLYEVYKDFPEQLLSIAMHRVRLTQLISQNKINSRHTRVHNRCLPLSSGAFHLSATYQQEMTTKVAYEIFDDSYENIKGILADVNGRDGVNVLNLSQSIICFFVAELLQKDAYDINIEMPRRILLLDPAKRLPDESFEGIYARFHEIFNYIPKVDLAGDDSTIDDFPDIPKLEAPADNASETNGTKNILEKLDKLPPEVLHFFCIVDSYGLSKSRNQLELTEDGQCPFDCIKSKENALDNVMDKVQAKREVWYRLNIEQLEQEPLPDEVTVDEMNIVAIYNCLILKGENTTDEQRNDSLELFKQISDIVDELLENDKDIIIDEDFGAEYDLRSDVKKKVYDGAQINDKIHKFHDFLCVNTCKLSLFCKGDADRIDLNQLNKKRDDIMAKIIQDSNWSPELKSSKDIAALMEENGLTIAEIHVAVDVFNFIDSKGELGATTRALVDAYEDKTFLHSILNVLNDNKLVMKTGMNSVTYVHWKHIKAWVINTYHLKRLDRVSLDEKVAPTTISLLDIETVSKATKRKNSAEEPNSPKRAKLDEPPRSKEILTNATSNENASSLVAPTRDNQMIAGMISEMVSVSTSRASTKSSTSDSSRLAEATIEYGAELDPSLTPQTKKTFPLKMAPWIRINGSINRRVLDKYAGTILLYCIENVGLTLSSLCTRFHYLLPVHVNEITQFLEDFGCLTKTALAKAKPITLFSKYEAVQTGPATDLDEFKDIVIEPTIDAVTKMSIFVGKKKYKEEFI